MVRLDDSITLYKELIIEMSHKVKNMHIKAVEILEDGDKSKALEIIKMDEYVNRYQEEINEKAIECLALLSPVATDLRIIIAGIKIACDLERIADYAKNISEYVIKNGQVDEVVLVGARKIAERFIRMFDLTMEAYKESDFKMAFEIPERDSEINEMFKEILVNIDNSLEKGLKLPHVVYTISMLRNFERAGDHTKNICEHIIYQVKGQHYDFN